MTRDEYMAGELAKWEAAWQGGHLPALFGAIRDCAAAEYPLPSWASLAALNLIADVHHNPPPKQPRGGSRHTKRTSDDLEHWRRWNAVRWRIRLGSTWDEVYEAAAVDLYGRPDAKGGSASAVKASYLLVQKARETKDPAFTFTFIDPGELPG